jgi:hypothetical protein
VPASSSVLPRLAMVLALLLAAVSLSASAPAVVAHRDEGFSTVAVPSPSAGAAVPSLAAIDALVFSNRYEKAEQAYAAVLAARPGDAQAHAAHALFLAYSGDLSRALS